MDRKSASQAENAGFDSRRNHQTADWVRTLAWIIDESAIDPIKRSKKSKMLLPKEQRRGWTVIGQKSDNSLCQEEKLLKKCDRLVSLNLRKRWSVPVHPQRLGYGANLKLYCGLAFAALTTKRRWHISENYGTHWSVNRLCMERPSKKPGSRIREQREEVAIASAANTPIGRERCTTVEVHP